MSVQSADHPSPVALPRRAVARRDRVEDLRRARAAAQVLRVAFPHVEQLRIELSFVDASSISPASQVHTLYPPARAFFTYRCPHSDCDGEFELADIIRRALLEATQRAQGSLLCSGARPGEKGLKRACQLRLGYTITARPRCGV